MSQKSVKGVFFVNQSRADLRDFPDEVKQDIGYELFLVQRGEKPATAKPLMGFAGVLEIAENDAHGTYRAVYTVSFERAVYVLHCFQKKSTQGIRTPQRHIDLVKQRLRAAEDDYNRRYAVRD